jgi:hypothetical protein
VNRTKRLVASFAIVLGIAVTSAFASSPAIAATASTSTTATASVALDPHPGPPWVYSGKAFSSQGACEAVGKAWVNSKQYKNWTCRYEGGLYRLYLLPVTSCPVPKAAARVARVTACG